MSAGFEIRHVTNAQAQDYTRKLGQPWQNNAYNLRELRKAAFMEALAKTQDIDDMRTVIAHLVTHYGLLETRS